MKTYVEILHSADGEKVSIIFEKMKDLGFKPALGEHDFVYIWKKDVVLNEIIEFLDNVVSKLKGSGAILKFTTIR
ncbi:MAG: hypothetical protein LN408_02765 [Candidatus Thermoplasmatota archaeon]|nr:hypothetical protein [Candidatus Thermoplasmatota archaeon]